MAVKVGTKVYSKYFGNGTIIEKKTNGIIMVQFTGELPESSHKTWCKVVLSFKSKLISYQEKDLWYYKDIDSIGHTPQHQLKTINTKIKIIKE